MFEHSRFGSRCREPDRNACGQGPASSKNNHKTAIMKSLRSLLLLLIVSGLLASGVLTAASMWGAAGTTDAAQRALVSKDVTADILPPPLYLIELRLVLSEAVEGTMPMA